MPSRGSHYRSISDPENNALPGNTSRRSHLLGRVSLLAATPPLPVNKGLKSAP